MNYYVLHLIHALGEIETDLLTDSLAGAGCDSFETEEGLLHAYIPENEYKANLPQIDGVLKQYGTGIKQRSDEFIPAKDWNALWESQYEPVRFGGFCFVHAPFHKRLPDVKYNIEIEPKMSFGTAHHPTTSLMIRFLEQEPPVGKTVLDMGCGTGVLGILAAMQGAKHVTGIDIDEWARRNAVENAERNGMAAKMTVELGDASLLKGRSFDRVMANINRNILVRDMKAYADTLPAGGILYVSGFYMQDLEIIEKECNAHRLFFKKHLEYENWAAAAFLKK